MDMEREKFGSRLGFILLSAGCAIGIGNVWKFPYLVGMNGGGAFVLLYLLFLVLLGVPVLVMEFSMGRAAQTSPVKMYQKLEKKGHHWHIHGIVCLIGSLILMMFYTTVTGWMLLYFIKMASGVFTGMDAAAVGGVYREMLAEPWQMLAAMAVTVVLGFLVCSIGLRNGLECVSKVMMSLLLLIMVVLAINSVFLDGAEKGLEFYLLPSLERMKAAGITNVIAAAMNQAFFTLSLGMGSMAIFGSYIGKDRALLGESVNVALLDTFVAIVSGLIILPACFSFGVDPAEGPGLIFVTMPNIFIHMHLGRIWGSMFFVFLSFAAFSTVLAVFENIMACIMDLTGWNRKKAGCICAFAMLLLSLPCLLGFNVLSWIQPMGKDSGIMSLEDFFVSNILLPCGSLIFVLFCTWKIGWGWKSFMAEANTGKGLKIAGWMRPYMTVTLPVIMVILIIMGLGII